MAVILTALLSLVAISNVAGLTQLDTGSGVVYRLEVVADVWLEGVCNRDINDILVVGKHTGYAKKRSLLKFEAIPVNCGTVQYATAYLFLDRGFKEGSYTDTQVPFISRSLEVHQVTKEWTESRATSTIRKDGENWVTAYGQIGGDTEQTPTDTVHVRPFRPRGYVGFDVTLAATHWDEGEDNYGLMFHDTNEGTNGRDLRFFGKGSSEYAPFLDVYCGP